MGQYDWLFYNFPPQDTWSNGMLPEKTAYFRGSISTPGAQIYLPYRAYLKPGFVCSEPHFHRDEEYIAIMGHDIRDPLGTLDAEVELWIGKEYDDMEKLVITEPTMIRIPQFYWHGPLEIKRLGKPVFIQPVLFSARYYEVRREVGEDGKEYYEAICEGKTPCRRNEAVMCTFCGKCREKAEGGA